MSKAISQSLSVDLAQIEKVDEPPPKRVSPGRAPSPFWSEVASRLQNDPGQWFKVRNNVSYNVKSAIQNGKYVALRPGNQYEVAIRHDGQEHRDGYGALFMRYIG